MEKSINMYQYNDFYKKNKRAIYHFILKMTHDIESSEELVNDVFVKVYKSMHSFDENKSSFKTWVYNIAANATIDFLRKKKLNTKSMYDVIIDNDGESIEQLDFESTDDDPLTSLITNESRLNITEAIKQLKPLQAEMITHLANGYSYDDIAAELNMNLNTVKGTIRQARAILKNFFQKPVLA